ncbi:hypothetical protein [Ferruginibacter sp. HRS2-29]|uniref:hypothetical protein n=1 Tax=Ferruginibacter sp. HRS2-29 TaxID=2487334 RepID=UPI0020CD9B4F|nr:hypothetical protein [Ferruginibacter sp. HRS2-29]MCP9749856.1 hypothetical protein [Ferruginibacter sp. HRS2-29]
MDKLILKVLLGIIHVFTKKDVDFDRLKIIAETKILMDRRRSPANYRQKQRKEIKNPLLITLVMYGLLGLFMAMVILARFPLLLGLATFHAYLLFMMAMTLVTDFSSVLLDTTDNVIILPKPVSSRTLFLARVVHILVYLLQFTIALAIFPLIAIFIKFGIITGLVNIVMVLLTVAFSVFITYLLYAFILRFANEQKVKDIISYFQLFMTIFFAIGFQVFPRMINLNSIQLSFALHWYSYLAPPIWMAVATEAFHDLNFDQVHLLMLACAFIIPIATVWLMIKFLAPSFSRKLAALNNNTEVTKKTAAGEKAGKDISEKISPLVCTTGIEKAGFEQTWKITGRDKGFRMQFYPSLAYILVFIFIIVFNSGKNFTATWHNLPDTKRFLAFIYLPMMSIISSLPIVAFNDNYVAAWVYQSTPLTNPGEVITGMLKSLLIKFLVPIYVVMFTACYYVWGAAIIDDFILGFFNNAFIFLLMAYLSDHYLPFSRQANIKMQTGKLIRMVMQLIIIGLLVFAHYSALKIYWLPSALIPLSAFGGYILLRSIKRLPWSKIAI